MNNSNTEMSNRRKRLEQQKQQRNTEEVFRLGLILLSEIGHICLLFVAILYLASIKFS